MTYRDNSVSFSLSDYGYQEFEYSLEGGSFMVKKYFVTEGQDPDKKIHLNLIKNDTTFRIGRKGSEDTASAVKDQARSESSPS